MKYTQARELIETILDQLDEKKLFDPVLGHREIENNPKARKFNPKTARPNKVKKRKWEIAVGTAGYGGYQSPGASVNDGRYLARERIKEAIDQQVDEMAQTNARYRQMGDHIDRASDAYWNKNKPGAGRKWRSLVRQDGKEAQSGTLYGHGGKKIKNPKKHRDSRL